MAPAVPLSRRTRVGLVGGGARVQVFERSICAQNGDFWRLLRYHFSSINFNQPPEAKPITQAR